MIMESFTQALRSTVPEEISSALRDSEKAASNVDQETALRRLAAATLQTAIDDALEPDSQPAYSAVRWLAGDTAEGMTLEMCCHLLGLTPERIRRSLTSHSQLLRGRLDRYQKIAAFTRTRVKPTQWPSDAYGSS